MTREFAIIFMILLAIWSLIVLMWFASSRSIMDFITSMNFAWAIIGYMIILLIYPVGKALFGDGDEYD